MRNAIIVTAKYEGQLRSLTLEQWSVLLDVNRNTIYSRKYAGYTDEEIVYGKMEVKKLPEDELNKLYRQFIFYRGQIPIQRQQNGIR